MPIIDLASFGNSRVEPRKPTSDGSTVQMIIPNDGFNHQILLPDGDRTYAEIRVLGAITVQLRVGFTDLLTMPVDGMLVQGGEVKEVESTGACWVQAITAPVTILLETGRG